MQRGRDVTNHPETHAFAWGRIIAYSWLLALAAIGLSQLVHLGAHEHLELPLPLHWLRDASLAVPAAAIAIVGATWLLHAARPVARDRLRWAVIASIAFALLSIPGAELHALLFGAEEAEEHGWLLHTALDSGSVLAGSVAFLIPVALLVGIPRTEPSTRPSAPASAVPPSTLRRPALAGAVPSVTHRAEPKP